MFMVVLITCNGRSKFVLAMFSQAGSSWLIAALSKESSLNHIIPLTTDNDWVRDEGFIQA